jgi:hypothetical protein
MQQERNTCVSLSAIAFSKARSDWVDKSRVGMRANSNPLSKMFNLISSSFAIMKIINQSTHLKFQNPHIEHTGDPVVFDVS